MKRLENYIIEEIEKELEYAEMKYGKEYCPNGMDGTLKHIEERLSKKLDLVKKEGWYCRLGLNQKEIEDENTKMYCLAFSIIAMIIRQLYYSNKIGSEGYQKWSRKRNECIENYKTSCLNCKNFKSKE